MEKYDNPANKVRGERGEGGAPSARVVTFLQSMEVLEKITVLQVF